MKDLTKLGTASLVAAGILAGAAKAGVYIVPPDIDQYKQKTDQTFYDMYQNQNSAIGKSVNPNAKPFLDSVNTGQRMVEGYTIPKVKGISIQGTTITSGTTLNLSLAGKRFQVKYTEDGVFVRPIDGGLRVKGSLVQKEDIGRTWCYMGGKYGCTVQRGVATDYSLNVVDGVVDVATVLKERTRSCGKWGCSGWSGFRDVQVISNKKDTVNLLALAKGEVWNDVAHAVRANTTLSEKQIDRLIYQDIGQAHGKYSN